MMQILPQACRNNKALTLIEVLIAMTLLAFISIIVYQATVRGFEVNYKLTNESNDYMTITVSVQAIEQDIAQMYTPYITIEKTPENSTPSNFWSAAIRADGFRRSRFTGSRDKITFVSNSNRRVQRNSPESDFLKITWEVERNSSGAYSLYRSTDTDAFNYEDARSNQKKTERIPLFENLTSAKFSFYKKETKTWEESWESEGPYVKAISRYPDMIKLKLELPDPTSPSMILAWEGIFKPNQNLNAAAISTQPAQPPSLLPEQ